MVACFACGTPDKDLTRNVVSFRCKTCNKLQCLICSTSHDCACDLFHMNQRRKSYVDSGQGSLNSSRISNRLASTPANRITTRRMSQASTFSSQTPVSNPLRRTKSTTNFTSIRISRIYCILCKEDYSKQYFGMHKKTKKHRNNMATPVKNEIENDSDAETFIEETL